MSQRRNAHAGVKYVQNKGNMRETRQTKREGVGVPKKKETKDFVWICSDCLFLFVNTKYEKPVIKNVGNAISITLA